MAFRNLRIEQHGSIRHITIDRPEKLNALDRLTIAELDRAFAQAEDEPEVRVLILAGAGEKAFVAGADIEELANASPAEALALARGGQAMMRRIETLGKPVIARIQGYALGGGLELAMACHLRIASRKARLGQPEIKLGLLPGFGGTQRLPRLIGQAAALEMLLTGEPIEAEKALGLGLVHRVVEPEALDREIETLAQHLAESAPLAIAAILDAVIRGNDGSLELGLDYEAQAFGVVAASEDMREGTRAFLEKRKPRFKGR